MNDSREVQTGGIRYAAGPMPTADQFEVLNMTPAHQLYLWLSGLFVVSLVLANVTFGKFFYFGSLWLGSFELRVEHSVGMFSFPVTFLLTDLLNEYFGMKAARRVTYLGLGVSLFAFVILGVGAAVPEGRGFLDDATFNRVFGSSMGAIIASLIAYVVGQFCDIYVFQFFKRLTGNRLLWLRGTGSTVISQLLDSFTVTLIISLTTRLSTGESPDWNFIVKTALTGYTMKFMISVAITPLMYAGREFVGRVFKLQPMPAGV
jgi:hypothetical protein